MYQLYAGIASYKLALRELREDEARRGQAATDPARRSVAAADPALKRRAIERDTSVPGLALAPARLASALSQLPRVACRVARWRAASADHGRGAGAGLSLAHEYLGRVHRELDDPRAEAASLTRAIEADPSQPAPYIALAELYRSWDEIERSLTVAQQGIVHANPAANPDLWYELGMAHQANSHHSDAFVAFTRAIRGGNVQAMLQRGQMYLRREDLASAKRDLEAYLGSPASALGVGRQIASGLLVEIARKQDTTKAYLRLPTRMDPKDDRH